MEWINKFFPYSIGNYIQYPMINYNGKECMKVKSDSEVASVVSLCDPIDCSLPGSSVHGIFWARILEWDAISFSRGSSRPRD